MAGGEWGKGKDSHFIGLGRWYYDLFFQRYHTIILLHRQEVRIRLWENGSPSHHTNFDELYH